MDFIIKQKITDQSYDHTVEEYYKNSLVQYPSEEFNKFIDSLEKKSLVLDLGCGPGRDARAFCTHKKRVIGLDRSIEMLRFASRIARNANFIKGDLLTLPFNPVPTFDGIWCSGVILHIPREYLQSVIINIFNIMNDNGILYISVKEGRGEKFIEDNRYNNERKLVVYYRKHEIVSILQKTGFKMIQAEIKDLFQKSENWVIVYARK